MSILHAWIFWDMALSVCWKIHCGVHSAHLLCNGNNICCLCLAFTSLWVYCMLGYSGKWHHYSVENSLWCIECRFTMQWQQYLLPVSYSLFKTLPYVNCPYSVLTVSLCCPYDVLISKRTIHNSSVLAIRWFYSSSFRYLKQEFTLTLPPGKRVTDLQVLGAVQKWRHQALLNKPNPLPPPDHQPS